MDKKEVLDTQNQHKILNFPFQSLRLSKESEPKPNGVFPLCLIEIIPRKPPSPTTPPNST